MISKNPEWVEESKMKTNKKYQKYNQLNLDSKELQQKLATVHAEQEALVMPRIKELQSIGRSVAEKCHPELMTYLDIAQKAAILKDHSWIYDSFRFKRLDNHSIILSKGFNSYVSYGKYEWKESEEISISRSYLHMSDREFAKLIRQRVWSWKNAEKRKAQKEVEKELQDARRAASKAEARLQHLEAKQSEESARLEAKRSRSYARLAV